jgi:hypothetical protein
MPGKGSAMRANLGFIARELSRNVLIFAASLGIGLPTAVAQEVELAEQQNVGEDTPVGASRALPGALSAELDPGTHSVASGWGGYDGATSNPVATATAEAWLIPRLSLMAGFGSTTQPGDVRLRAEGGLRLMVLDQRRHGINATIGFVYRQDRFANEEGTLEWSALLSRRFGATLALARLLYAQDGEGDDHEGEFRVAGLHDIGRKLLVGIDGRVRASLGSSDPHRAEHANPTLEFNVGPLVAYNINRWSVMAEAGLSGQKVDQLRTGMLVLGGLGAAF